MIYGFLTDEMFKQTSLLEYGNTSLPPVCFLDDVSESYFQTRLTVTDPREVRNVPAYTGKIKVHFDSTKLESPVLFSLLSAAQINILFSLFEKIYTSGSDPATSIENDILADTEWNSIYSIDSLKLGRVYIPTGLDSEHPGPQQMVDWFEVTVRFEDIQKEETFKVWMNRARFKGDYPLSTIVKVILPCDQQYILNPSAFPNIIETLIRSNEFSFGELDSPITTEDSSGLLTYRTKYNISSTSTKMLPFGILYKGSIPSSLDIRKAIRDKLLGFGTAPEEMWESLLPDLFVIGQYFIIPIWNNTTIRPDRTMFPSILPMNKVDTVISRFFPSLDEEYISENHQLLVCAQSEIFLISIPDPLNVEGKTLLQVHSTYQHYSPQFAAHAYMTAATKEFNIRLNRCMAVLMGETVLEEFIENTIDEKKYLSFVSTGIEYHVMTKESYNSVVW